MGFDKQTKDDLVNDVLESLSLLCNVKREELERKLPSLIRLTMEELAYLEMTLDDARTERDFLRDFRR